MGCDTKVYAAATCTATPILLNTFVQTPRKMIVVLVLLITGNAAQTAISIHNRGQLADG